MITMFKINIILIAIISIYYIYDHIKSDNDYVTSCCMVEYRVIEYDNEKLRYWCVNCKKWCELVDKDNK